MKKKAIISLIIALTIVVLVISMVLIMQNTIQTTDSKYQKEIGDLQEANRKLTQENIDYKNQISLAETEISALKLKNSTIINGVQVDKDIDTRLTKTVINFFDVINSKDIKKIKPFIYVDEQMMNASAQLIEVGFKLKSLELKVDKVENGLREDHIEATDEKGNWLSLVVIKFKDDWRITFAGQ